MTGGDGRYSVKFDANRDGELDALYFSEQKTANLFSECFVNNSQNSNCINWMYEQAKYTNFTSDMEGIQLYKNGRKFGDVQSACWEWGIDGLKAYAAKLWKNIINSSLADKAEIYASVAKLASGVTTESETKAQIKKILTTANKPESPQKLNNAQIDLLVDIIWTHRFSLFGDDNELTIKATFPIDFVKTAMDAVDEKFFASCDAGDDGTYGSGCANYPDLNLTGAEMMEVHRLFGGFIVDEPVG